jgi:hypothetical protein
MTTLPADQWLRDLDKRKADRQVVWSQFGTQNATATGTASDNAAALNASLVVVSTATTTGQGVVLPQAFDGAFMALRNSSANTISVYPKGADTVNGGTAAVSVGTASSVIFFAPSAGGWFSK